MDGEPLRISHVEDAQLAEFRSEPIQTAAVGTDLELKGYPVDGASATGNFDGFSEAMLVRSVKRLQRHHDATPLWRSFCASNGSTVLDPARHDALFLKSFLLARVESLRQSRPLRPEPPATQETQSQVLAGRCAGV